MRIATHDGRLTLLTGESSGIDVERASDGRFLADPATVFDRWDEFRGWADGVEGQEGSFAIVKEKLGPPSPRPRQIFAIGLNYSDHAAESGFAVPESGPVVFTKFASALTGPVTTVILPPDGENDWEAELVVVIGRQASEVSQKDAWSHVAGLTVGQDLSERILQRSGPAPQFSLGKSHAGFAPTGPVLVTADEFDDPDDLEIGCSIDGEIMQKDRTRKLIFTVPSLIEHLSRTVTLLPGDLIFTGTPAGVGMGREPQRWLQPGEELVTWIEGIGELRQRFV